MNLRRIKNTNKKKKKIIKYKNECMHEFKIVYSDSHKDHYKCIHCNYEMSV